MMVDVHSRELVVAALEGYSETVTPAYELARHELRESLVGSLASIEDIATEVDQRRSNAKLLAALVGTLPKYLAYEPHTIYNNFNTRKVDAFVTKDPAEARDIHASVVYHPHYYAADGLDDVDETWKKHRSLFVPSVIVGSRAGSGKKTTDMLLYPVRQYQQHGLSGVSIKTSHFDGLTDVQARRHVQDFSRGQIKAMFTDGGLRLDQNTPGALRTTHPLRMIEKIKGNDTASLATDLQKARLGAAGIERYGLQCTPLALDKDGLSNAELAEFDVFDRLIGLAARFDRTAAFKSVLLPPPTFY